VDVLCLPVDGVVDVLVRDENEFLLVHLLQHEDVLSLPVDGRGDVLDRDENALLMFTFFSIWMFSSYL
jgi:hypothetical protein